MEEVELSTSKLKNVINANLIDLEDKKKHLDDKLNRINLLQEEMEVLEKEIEKAYIYKKNNEEYIQMLKNIDQYMKKQDIEAYVSFYFSISICCIFYTSILLVKLII